MNHSQIAPPIAAPISLSTPLPIPSATAPPIRSAIRSARRRSHRVLLRLAVCAPSTLSTSRGRRGGDAPSRDDGPSPVGAATAPTSRRRDLGQATTEYALVLLGAAAVALLVVTWATAGGGAGRIGRLFDRVIDAVLGQI